MPFDESLIDKGSWFYDTSDGSTPPPVGDGVTYSRALGWQSPEGNFYGQERWVRDWYSAVYWNGLDYQVLEVDGAVTSVSALDMKKPPYRTPQPFEIWSVPRDNWPPEDLAFYDGRDKEYYFWNVDTQDFQIIEWYWTCEGDDELPRPGLKIGSAHVIVYDDIKVMWNGYFWKRYSIEMLEGGEIVEDLESSVSGLMLGLSPGIRLVYVSANELSLQTEDTDYDFITIHTQSINISPKTSVFTQTPVLNWSDTTESFSQSALDAETSYWVYLANRVSDFNITSGNFPYDYRGRLFCSGTEASNNLLGSSGAGLDAMLIGRAETNSEGEFIHEYDVSYVSKESDLKETFREYSDFDLMFVDQDTLRLHQNYGSYGQIYIPECIYYIGDDREVYANSVRLEIETGGSLTFDYSAIADNTTYYVYLAGDVDLYNDNEINIATNRPWHPEDEDDPDGEGYPHYDAAVDLRLSLFLSTCVPDNNRLDESYNGFWTRWVGIIQTDANGKFKYAKNLSVIRQPTLNHADIEDIASISIVTVSESSFKIVKKPGTTGAVYVGGIPVYVEDASNTLAGHSLDITSQTKTYTESNPASPLSSSGVVTNTIVNNNIYVYLANSRTLWGSTSNSLFFSTLAPTGGYLSNNWPGNQCRWLCTLSLAPATYSAELISNSTFSSSSSWSFGTGWTYDSDDKKAAHTTPSATGTLSQSITITAGSKYEFIASVRDRNVGGVSVSLGGTQGQVLWANTAIRQYIVATNTNGLVLTPNENFDGSIDNVYCKKILTGKLTGSYVVDSVGFGAATLNDTTISPNEGWSSAKIVEELNKLATQFGLSVDAQDQANSGLPLILDYYSSTQLRLRCVATLPETIVFPDLTTLTINSEGFVAAVTGSASTLYYVYIDKDSATDGFIVSTTAPDATYPGKQTLGDTKILVGYVGFASTNTMTGTHNVYSFWNETTKIWEAAITAANTTYISTSGMVIPPSSATLAVVGNLQGHFYCRSIYSWIRYYDFDCYVTAISNATATCESANYGPPAPSYWGRQSTWSLLANNRTGGYITTSLSGVSPATVVNSLSVSVTCENNSTAAYIYDGRNNRPIYQYSELISSAVLRFTRQGNVT